MLLQRGETIARTESIAAFNAGRQEGFEQLIDSGRVQRSQVKVRWSATMDTRTRDAHRSMHKTEVEFGTPFRAPSGALLMFPGDTSLGASGHDTINCRCTAQIKIDFLGAAD